MLEFHSPTLCDKTWVDEVLRHSKHIGCVYCFGQLSLWHEKYNTQICRVGDALCGIAGTKEKYYLYPAGGYDIEQLVKLLSADAQERGIPLRFSAAEEWQKQELDDAFPERFEFFESRDDSDYIYRAEDLAQLSGRKYHSKRNHIAKFIKAHPDWKYEVITSENADECAAMADQWLAESKRINDDLLLENRIIKRALGDMSSYGLDGALIRIDGRVAAFTIGEKLNHNIYDIHFEKALGRYAEAYTLINREFAAGIAQKYELINREEDMGLEGLRKAKLSYNPLLILKKYTIIEVKRK